MLGKAIGGILLVIGTSVGGAILALPMVTAQAGFGPTVLLLLGVWALMTLAALMVMEVSLWFPPGKNLISMAEATLGKPGKVFTWIVYLLLLYSLIAAFLSGGGDMLRSVFSLMDFSISGRAASLIFVGLIIPIVAYGIAAVDWANRILMLLKLGSLLLLMGMLAPLVSPDNLGSLQEGGLGSAVTPVLTAFGYAIITPSLRSYYDGHPKILRSVVIIGSLIPLILYVAWIFVIQGALSSAQLMGLAQSAHPVSELVDMLSTHHLSTEWIAGFAHFFTSISILTTFLGVSLCLRDFLLDGLGLAEDFEGRSIATGLTFLPPLLIMLFRPDAFLLALRYAGLWCVLLLILLPFAMVYSGCYIRHFHAENKGWLMKPQLLIGLIVVSCGLLVYSLMHL